MKKILMIAYHYPPVKVSSAVQRTLKFSRYLLDENWQPVILSASPKAAIAKSDEQLAEIPASVPVVYAFARDTLRHFSIRGKYLGWMALPDRWVSWTIGGYFSGIKLLDKHKPDVIFSTYPIATAHLIAYLLHKKSGVPWIADFRDSMTEADYPTDKTRRAIYRWIERKAVKHCTYAIFTTRGAVDMYASRYPELPKNRWQLISNGFDEENFQRAEENSAEHPSGDRITILHSGVIYPSERDPRPLLHAISELKTEQKIPRLKILLRATGHDDLILSLTSQLDIEDVVEVSGSISYQDALQEMIEVDGLLILQAENCNHQIPAKSYEYMRAQTPILALTDDKGDTAALLRKEGYTHIAPLDQTGRIKSVLLEFIADIENGSAPVTSLENAAKYNRQSATRKLSRLLDSL